MAPMSNAAPSPAASLDARGMRFAICVSRWNETFTEKLLQGATDALIERGARREDLHVYRCAGAFELAPLAVRVARKGGIDGLIALGCLIEGDTDHYRLLADSVTSGLSTLALECASG